ncbi:unnamed protein product [Pedinophyceae sp. YPF-701]|nr:unnamed protein product [Pedinophyceae sp. YPF-701]
MSVAMLCGRVSAMSLSSKRAGIAAAPRVAAAAPSPVMQRCAAMEISAGYKLKTRKAAAKRFKVTSAGKIMRRHPMKQHINEKMNAKRLRRLSNEEGVELADYNNVIKCLPYAGIKRSAAKK